MSPVSELDVCTKDENLGIHTPKNNEEEEEDTISFISRSSSYNKKYQTSFRTKKSISADAMTIEETIPLQHLTRRESIILRSTGHRYVRRRREKSIIILVSIVLIFVICHTYRLSLRLYELAHPQNNTLDHFRYCRKAGLHHIPVAFYVLLNFHHLFLVINSSVNCIIYCCIGKEFRSHMLKLFIRK